MKEMEMIVEVEMMIEGEMGIETILTTTEKTEEG